MSVFTLPNAEQEALDNVVDEEDGIGFCVSLVDPERPNARSIVDCGVLIALDRLAVFSLGDQELDVTLDLMSGNLLL